MSTGRDALEARNDGRAPSPDGLLPLPVRVGRVRRETADVATLELIPAAAFAFVAGQFKSKSSGCMASQGMAEVCHGGAALSKTAPNASSGK
jgi:hypothetical protein